MYLEFEVRRVHCRSSGKVKRERLEFLADNPFYENGRRKPLVAAFGYRTNANFFW